MPRMEADYRISVKVRKSGTHHKIELIQMPHRNRFWIRYNGVNSIKWPDGITRTELKQKIVDLITGD